MPETMKCAACTAYGPAGAMTVVELPVPRPGPSEIVVRVAAATVNPADLVLRSGAMAPIISGGPPYVGGLELAGTVAAAGAGSRWKVGDRVAAITTFIPSALGAHCQFVLVHDDSAAAVPADLDLAAAATIPMSGLTAQLAIDRSGSGPRTIAVTGAGGAVGAYCLEIATAEGLRTFAVVRENYRQRVLEAGASEVVDADGDVVGQLRRIAPAGVDAVIDCALMGDVLIPAIRDGARFIAVRAYAGALVRGITAEHISVRDYGRAAGKLERLLVLAGEGRLRPHVARVLPFAEGAEAHRLLERGGLGGRVVLSFDAA